MIDYQIQNSTRRCAATGRELKPGEACYSVLLEEGGQFQRQDFSITAWVGPPPGAFSFWKGRVPGTATARRPTIDDELLLECFHRLEGELEPAKLSFRYVLALLLIRRRKLRLEQTHQEGDLEIMQVRCVRTGDRCQVIDPRLSDEELEAVQEDVFRVLGWQ